MARSEIYIDSRGIKPSNHVSSDYFDFYKYLGNFGNYQLTSTNVPLDSRGDNITKSRNTS